MVVLGVFLVAALLAATPIPSKVITVTVSTEKNLKGSIVVSQSVPSGSTIFPDEQNILASIRTGNSADSILCSLSMTTVTSTD